MYYAKRVGMLLAIVLWGTCLARGKTIEVPRDYSTIQEAMNVAEEGDEVVVSIGRYKETISFKGINVLLRSIDSNDPQTVSNTIIDGTNKDKTVVTFSGEETYECVLSGFTIRNGYAPYTGGINGNHTKATIQYCEIKDNTSYENWPKGGGGLAFCDGRIQYNIITNNRSGDHGGGLYKCNGYIKNNIISKNKSDFGGGLSDCDGKIEGNIITENYSGTYGGGVYSCAGTIQNNLIAKNFGGRLSGGLKSCDGLIENNTIVYNHTGGLLHCGGVIRNCIIWGNDIQELYQCSVPSYCCIKNWISGGIGNISSDPRFVDIENKDFRLSENSSCIDTGCNVPGITNDIDGDERPFDGYPYPRGDGSDFDIGCDEFSPAVSITPKSRLVTTESGGSAHFDVTLNAQPKENVTVNFSISDSSEGILSISSLLFSPDPQSWNSIKFVSVKGEDDNIYDGNVQYFLSTNVNSNDPLYDDIYVADITLTNIDDDPLKSYDFESGNSWTWWSTSSVMLNSAVGTYELMPGTDDWSLAIRSWDKEAEMGHIPALCYGYWQSPRETVEDRITYISDMLYTVKWYLRAGHDNASYQPGLRFRISTGSDSCGGDLVIQEWGGYKPGISTDVNSPSVIEHYWYPPQWLVEENVSLYPDQAGLVIYADMFDNRALATGKYWIPKVEVYATEPPLEGNIEFTAPPFNTNEWRDTTQQGDVSPSIDTDEGITITYPASTGSDFRLCFCECVDPATTIPIEANTLYRMTFTVTSSGDTPPVLRQRMLTRNLYLGAENLITPTVPLGSVFGYAKPGTTPRAMVCYLAIGDQYLPGDDLLFSVDTYAPIITSDPYEGTYNVNSVKIEEVNLP